MRGLWVLALYQAVGVPAAGANRGIRVEETQTRLSFAADHTDLRLVLANTTGLGLEARIDAELIDPDDTRIGHAATRTQRLVPGLTTLALRLSPPIAALSPERRKGILLDRLRYVVRRVDPPPGFQSEITGLLAVAQIVSNAFELQVGHGVGTPGLSFRAIVRASHPVSAHPVAGVAVEATLELDDRRALRARGATNARGQALLDFPLPAESHIGAGSFELTVVGRRAGLEAQVESEVESFHILRIALSTDRPLYQPGQRVRTRILLLASDGRPLADAPGTLRIRDQEDGLVFTAAATTSRFGVATADWPIPESARLGSYALEFQVDGPETGNRTLASGTQTIRVSRYELPQFAVTSSPDRPYYLPGQNASIQVRADYLFGKPVTRGHVRVALESDRRWNHRDQKWELEEAQAVDGELDGHGAFAATLDLSKEHADLGEDRSEYRDLDGTAYVTDATTARTEEQRFRLRLSRNPIHVYVAGEEAHAEDGGSAGLARASFYVSTFYPDGAPASCDVQILRKGPEGEGIEPRREPVHRLHTSRFGLAKVAELPVRRSEEDGDEVALLIVARDKDGRSAEIEQTLSIGERLRLDVRRHILAPGQPVEVSVRTPARDVLVSVVRPQGAGVALRSRIVSTRSGRASIVFPYEASFKGRLIVAARALDEDHDDYGSCAAQGVFYPHVPDLDVVVGFDRRRYRPGDAMAVSLDVKRRDGQASPGVLGLVVVDKALQERASTERDMHPLMGFLGPLRPEDESLELAGLSARDVLNLDLARPIPEGLDLVAEMLGSRSSYYEPGGASSEVYDTDAGGAFRRHFASQLQPFLLALQARYPTPPDAPDGLGEVQHVLQRAGLRLADLRDPWGVGYRLRVEPRRDTMWVEAVSAGPDKRHATADDLVAAERSWPYFRRHGVTVDEAARRHFERTGRPIPDLATLRDEVAALGETLDAWRDPWGGAYRVELSIAREYAYVTITSRGPDGVFAKPRDRRRDDVPMWSTCTPYFANSRAAIEAALGRHLAGSQGLPQTDADLTRALAAEGLAFGELRDPWGAPYYVTFRLDAGYGYRPTVTSYRTYQRQQQLRRQLTPLTLRNDVISVRSAGPDGRQGTGDDFSVRDPTAASGRGYGDGHELERGLPRSRRDHRERDRRYGRRPAWRDGAGPRGAGGRRGAQRPDRRPRAVRGGRPRPGLLHRERGSHGVQVDGDHGRSRDGRAAHVA